MVKANKAQQEPSKQQSKSTTWIIYAVFVAIVAGGIALYNYQANNKREIARQQAEALEQQRQELAQRNQAVGLPGTYPQDFMPLYPGVELLEASADETTADDGAPMDMWHVLSQTDDEKQAVYDFYTKKLEEEDMRQTTYISLPTGYSMSYADENRIVQLRIEKLRKDPKLQVELTVYVVKGEPATKAPVTSNPPV